MTMAELPNPSPHISKMSQGQLRTLVEALVRSNGDRLGHGIKDARPSWWPPDVAWINSQIRTRRHSQQDSWTEALRKVVRSCYRHHGQEHRLEESMTPADHTLSGDDDDDDIRIISMTNSKDTTKDDYDYEADMPILQSGDPVPTSGPIPAQAVSSWKQADLNSAALPEAEAATSNNTPKEENPLKEIFICFFCEKEFKSRDQLQTHQKNSCRSTIQTRSKRKARRPYYKCKEAHPDSYKRPEHKVFVEAVGLIPRSKLATFQKRKNKEDEIEFEEIEIDESPIPKTPTTPRSAKSIMSQLSRDLSPPPSAAKLRRSLIIEEVKHEADEESEEEQKSSKDGTDEKDDDNESTASSKSDRVEFNMRKIPSLLAIDLCSLLGQRVKKHVDKLDNSERTSYEDFCHTPVKYNALDRLRNRPSTYPVTFRKTKRLCPPQCHWYKFTKRDRREFLRIVATGLNRRARRLKKLVVPCKVQLRRLKEKDIIDWTTPKKRPLMIQAVRPGQPWQCMNYYNHQGLLVRNAYNRMTPAGPPYGLPLQTLNPSPQALQQNRAYKAVLSGRNQPANQSLSVYSLPLSHPSNNRNFGKPLQPTGFYGPASVRRPFNRPNILSKENGAINGNRGVRRLSMNSPNKQELTAEYLNQLPSSIPHRQRDDDVISISSTDSESEPITQQVESNKRPAPEDRNNNSSNKRSRLSAGNGGGGAGAQVVLFRCHLCQAEITCKIGQTDFIKKHFVERHAVNNIHLLEHLDSNGQKVVTIVEDNGPKNGPTAPPKSSARSSDMAPRNVSFSGRMGPGAVQSMSNRNVLRDSQQRQANYLARNSVRRSDGHDKRSSDGREQWNNNADSQPAEIIILD